MARRPAPVEMPVSDDPLEQALSEERRIAEANEKSSGSGRNMSDKDRDKYLRSSETQKFKKGGMVRGCKSIQMTGKGFKGTF